MQRLLISSACVLIAVSFINCSAPVEDKSGIRVTVEGGGQFPEFLAGKWVGGEGWEFTFEPNGVISSAVFSLGRIKMKPGQITRVPMKMGGEGVYEPGEWLVDYDPNTRELTVEVSLKNFRIQIGDSIVEGKGTDIFTGKVSENGKDWLVTWNSFPQYKAHTPEYPDYNMAVDLDYGNVAEMIFEKK
jgi:hypothetical protein